MFVFRFVGPKVLLSVSMCTEVKYTLLAAEWGSKHGEVSTLSRVFAIELAKRPKVHVSVFVPRCDQKEMDEARSYKITLVQAARRPGFDETDWLCYPPHDLQIDIVIGHGVKLGCQAQIIRDIRRCKWIQFVHTDPEELGMFKRYSDTIAKGETKHETEVELCVMADFVVAVGPKLAEAYRSYLRPCKKDQKVFELTPGIFCEFSGVVQATQEGNRFRVLAFGRGDSEDFSLNGFDIAAKAVGKLKNANLIFVGACNKQQDNVADNLKQCDIPPERLRVKTYQSRQQLKDILCEGDLAIMPSRTEGFGLAALQALSAGLPILASGNSGFGEALSKVSFGSGYVIHSDDPMVWAEEIKKVRAKRRETRLEESDTLRTRYAKTYNWEKQCNDLVTISRSIFAGMTFSSF